MVKIFRSFPVIFLVVLSTSCSPKQNQIVFDKAANQDILYGDVTVDAFNNYRFNDWYLNEYNSYISQGNIIDSISPLLDNVSIKIVMGTWCGDSKREVPRFINLLDNLSFNKSNLIIIGVNRSKVCPECGIDEGYVDFVPTFIFFRDNVEIGRIIESPTKSLEEDLYLIVK